MTPPSEYGVGLLGPNSWLIGSLMLYEKAGSVVADVVATWEDSDGTWCLQYSNSPLTAITIPPGDSNVNRI